MDTRKLILHIDGDTGVQSRIELEDFGTTHYIDGDTDMVASLVKRYNAYSRMVEKLRDSLNYIPVDGDAERDLREAIEDLLATLTPA